MMIKLYRYNEKKKCYFYNEAWIGDGVVTEHVGQVGKEGRAIEHEYDSSLSDEQNILNVLQPAINGNYKEIPLNKHYTLIVEYKVNGFGTSTDLDKRYALQDRLNEKLGWTGLGYCDGGSIGSGTMEVCCFVVDFEIAKAVISKDLKRTEFSDYIRIYDENNK